MLEYFTEQLSNTAVISADDAARMIEQSISNGGDEATVTEYYNSKVGQHSVVYIKRSNLQTEFQKCFEDEVETVLYGLQFIEMNGSTPVFSL